MRVLVVSDTHGDLRNFKEVLEAERPIGMVMHLGDVRRDAEEIRTMVGAENAVAIVRGNGDWFCNEPWSRDFSLGKHRIHMEHGHELPGSLQSMIYKAKELGAEYLFFGHTHKPFFVHEDGVYLVNPGSISEPRQMDGRPSYIIMVVKDNGEISLEQKYLD